MFKKHLQGTGFRSGERATVIQTGTLVTRHGLVHLVTDDGAAVLLSADAQVTNPPREHARLDAGTLGAIVAAGL